MKTILLVDDEPRMLDLLTLFIEPKGYHCVKMTSGLAAIQYLQSHTVDLILLDIMMPELDGWVTCERIRAISDVPVIMITARSEKSDIVKGLTLGADDYISKPFDEDELLARIEAVIRRQKSVVNDQALPIQTLKLNEASFELTYQGRPVPLTRKEFAMMGLFLKHPNRVFTRDHLITIIWGHDVDTEDRTIDSHVRNLREKFRKLGYPIDDFLVTVWGVGYKWEQ